MEPGDIRQWAAHHRAAAERENEELRRRPLTPAEAYTSALALLVFDEALNGDPFTRPDPVGEREDEQVRHAWATLRARWSQNRRT
ncbi:MAG TPA: hypothetical protein VJ276_18225 [Thermoanaerobaculia bacterium]|nr:hypothetical protein [Thermoanaerobaculia bacterium]